jgi:hypothetical protein
MKLTNIEPNQTQIVTNTSTVLFSYSTPVAACVNGRAYRTSQKWSTTTSKHINSWLKGLGGMIATEKPQSFFDNLIP